MSLKFDLKNIISHFDVEGELLFATPFGDGHINDTFLVEIKDKKNEVTKYTLQRINTYVFKEPDKVMENILAITSHIKDKLSEDDFFTTYTVMKSKSGTPYYIDENNNFWRMQTFIDHVIVYDHSQDEKVVYNAAKGFGKFAYYLSDFDLSNLHDTIPNFHNFKVKYQDLVNAFEQDSKCRAKEVKEQFSFYRSFETEFGILEQCHLPKRVTHNDTKLNNILLDEKTNLPVAVIDLDTVMSGLIATDFGDSIRSISGKEGCKSLSQIQFSPTSFEHYAKGYLEQTREILTKEEVDVLPLGVKLISLSLGMRFLTDYLNGDVYFKTDYPQHNLDRALSQIKLAQEFDKNQSTMSKIIHQYI